MSISAGGSRGSVHDSTAVDPSFRYICQDSLLSRCKPRSNPECVRRNRRSPCRGLRFPYSDPAWQLHLKKGTLLLYAFLRYRPLETGDDWLELYSLLAARPSWPWLAVHAKDPMQRAYAQTSGCLDLIIQRSSSSCRPSRGTCRSKGSKGKTCTK